MLDKHGTPRLTAFLSDWHPSWGPAPATALIAKVTALLNGLDALKAMVLCRFGGATQAQLNAVIAAWCNGTAYFTTDGAVVWQGCCCNGQVDPNCPVHGTELRQPVLAEPITFQCMIIGLDGNAYYDTLEATSVSHAFTEAEYEFEGRCVAARPVTE